MGKRVDSYKGVHIYLDEYSYYIYEEKHGEHRVDFVSFSEAIEYIENM